MAASMRRDFLDFLDQDSGAGKYAIAIGKLVATYQEARKNGAALPAIRLPIDLQDLQEFNEDLHR